MQQSGSDAVFGIDRSILGQAWRWRAGPGREPGSGPSDIVRGLFAARGARPEEFDRLQAPTIRDWLPDPSIFRDMEEAADRLAAGIRTGERIVIFGDYDVDGATSAALLVRLLRDLGADVGYYIPDRLLEGYGPSAAALERLAQTGARLIVTVDCGTHGFDAFAAARARGLDIIVVDHHKAGTTLPPARAIVNPNRLDEGAGAAYAHLAAVGMCFLLGVALNRRLRDAGHFASRAEPRLLELLDLVALGTVADVALLTGLNRAFVTQGLKVMATRRNVGLAALADVAGLDRAPRARDLGFLLGPRVNAGGRVGRADLGVRLLTTEDPAEAAGLALEMDRLNTERRAIEATVLQAAEAVAARSPDDAVLVVAGEGWHPGIVGIVAGRLKERFGRPAFVIGIAPGGDARGSGRSISGVDLGAAVLAARDSGLVATGGGHAMAAGVGLAGEGIAALRAFLNERLAPEVGRARAGQALLMDAAVAPGGVCAELARALDQAGPFGAGWPTPRVAAGPFRVVRCDVVGEAHVRVLLQGADGCRLKAVAFRQSDTPLGAALSGARDRRLHVAGQIVLDRWNQRDTVEMHLDDAAWAA